MTSYNDMDFTPLFDNILLEPEVQETVLLTNEPTQTENCKVLAIGNDVKTVKVGDILATFVFGIKHAERDGKKYYTIRELPAFIQGKYGEGR